MSVNLQIHFLSNNLRWSICIVYTQKQKRCARLKIHHIASSVSILYRNYAIGPCCVCSVQHRNNISHRQSNWKQSYSSQSYCFTYKCQVTSNNITKRTKANMHTCNMYNLSYPTWRSCVISGPYYFKVRWTIVNILAALILVSNLNFHVNVVAFSDFFADS